MKKSASDFVQNLIDGKFDVANAGSMNPQELHDALEAKIADEYSYTEEELLEALSSHKEALSQKIGIELTEDQLSLLSGGKNNASVAANSALYGGIAGGSALIGTGVAITAAAVAFGIVFK